MTWVPTASAEASEAELNDPVAVEGEFPEPESVTPMVAIALAPSTNRMLLVPEKGIGNPPLMVEETVAPMTTALP